MGEINIFFKYTKRNKVVCKIPWPVDMTEDDC
jgi:hypothetical protein